MISQSVTCSLNRRATKQTDAATVPFSRWHSVDADVVCVSKAIKSVLLNFRQIQHFIAFAAMQQKGSIMDNPRLHCQSPR